MVRAEADLLLCILLNGISWYCVVKRLGFCGRAGYLVWAVLYVFLNIGRLQTITWTEVGEQCGVLSF